MTDADTANDDACVTSFLRGFGERVLRRPVADADVAFYKRPLEGGVVTPAALADLIGLLFSAPDVLYVVERAGGTDEASRPVGPYELASRLSYHFWQTLPDDELFALARSGELSKDDVYAAQVDRSAASPRARKPLDTFFAEWFRLDELDRLDTRIGDPVFDAFVGRDVPTLGLREEMFADVLDAAAWETGRGGTIRSLLENRRSFARTPELAAIYKVPVWDGISEPPAFAEPARAGLVTRAAFLATGSANTRPIMKGVRLRMGLLCDSVPPPPPSAANTHVELSPTLTTRQVVEQLTQGEGSGCAGCHTKELNPLGFATENFDALGRFRTTQRLFDPTGMPIGEPPIDTTTAPHVVRKDDRVARDAIELTSYIAESQKVEGCFARNYFRYAFVRNETEGDQPIIDELSAIASSGKSIAEVMKAVALRREFRMKITTKEGM